LGQTQHEYFISIQIAFQTYRKAFDTYITLQKIFAGVQYFIDNMYI